MSAQTTFDLHGKWVGFSKKNNWKLNTQTVHQHWNIWWFQKIETRVHVKYHFDLQWLVKMIVLHLHLNQTTVLHFFSRRDLNDLVKDLEFKKSELLSSWLRERNNFPDARVFYRCQELPCDWLQKNIVCYFTAINHLVQIPMQMISGIISRKVKRFID